MTTDTLTAQVLNEPVTGAFVTQHSTEHNKRVAHQGLALLTEVGSTMHGVSTNTTDDDIDEIGVCVEGPTDIIGTAGWHQNEERFEQYEYRTQAVNQRSGAGDIDRCIYSLRKFAWMAAKGSATVMMPLFVQDEHIRFINWVGHDLRANRDMFITKQQGAKFLSYLKGQRDRYLNPERQDSKHAVRPELVAQYGWDTKTGYHAMRLAIQGTELMRVGTITLPMYDVHREFLLDVRNGKYTKEQVTQHLDEVLIPDLEEATEISNWPDKPDYQRIDTWLADTYRKVWTQRGI